MDRDDRDFKTRRNYRADISTRRTRIEGYNNNEANVRVLFPFALFRAFLSPPRVLSIFIFRIHRESTDGSASEVSFAIRVQFATARTGARGERRAERFQRETETRKNVSALKSVERLIIRNQHARINVPGSPCSAICVTGRYFCSIARQNRNFGNYV